MKVLVTAALLVGTCLTVNAQYSNPYRRCLDTDDYGAYQRCMDQVDAEQENATLSAQTKTADAYFAAHESAKQYDKCVGAGDDVAFIHCMDKVTAALNPQQNAANALPHVVCGGCAPVPQPTPKSKKKKT